MDVGMMMIYSSYGWDEGSDGQMWEEELRLAEIAADSGFDCLWSAEHHFNDYSFVPDNPPADDPPRGTASGHRCGHGGSHTPLAQSAARRRKCCRSGPAERRSPQAGVRQRVWRGVSSKPLG